MAIFNRGDVISVPLGHAIDHEQRGTRPGWDWHPLKGSLSGYWSVSVNGNWRLTFTFENGDAVLIDYQDYN
jgi:plasmid maintenance system killer protein